jgi:cytochrome c oxidase subunit I
MLFNDHLDGIACMFFVGLAYAIVRKERAADSPRGAVASTLEWTLPLLPPIH